MFNALVFCCPLFFVELPLLAAFLGNPCELEDRGARGILRGIVLDGDVQVVHARDPERGLARRCIGNCL